MTDLMQSMPAWLTLFAVLFLLLNAVLWFFLPFVVMSMNNKLGRQNRILLKVMEDRD